MSAPNAAPTDVILRVLQNAQRPVYRTALVKLIYLVDYVYAQHAGRTLTGFDYIWDSHGPNAFGNEIVKQADLLESLDERIEIERGVTPSGGPKFLYRVRPGVEQVRLSDELGELVIHDVVMTYGHLNWALIAKAAKATKPILQAQPGDHLDLTPDSAKQQRFARVQASLGERQRDTGGPGVSLLELKSRYGLSG